MGIVDQFIRFLKDDYLTGAQATSHMPVLKIDPQKFNVVALTLVLNDFSKDFKAATGKDFYSIKKEDKEEALKEFRAKNPQAFEKLADGLSAEIRRQTDSQFQAISTVLTSEQMVNLLISSVQLGMHANSLLRDQNICVVSDALERKSMKEFISQQSGLKLEQLRDIPGTDAIWREAWGRHEGRHCNQEILFSDDKDLVLKKLVGELDSDLAVIEFLEKQNRPDMIQALIDYRILESANPNFEVNDHATSIFLGKPGPHTVTKEHVEAANIFRQEMTIAVMKEYNITQSEALKMQKEEPQKFSSAVKKALEEDKIPSFREPTLDEIKQKIAEKMNVSVEELNAMGSDKLPDITKAYDDLKTEGAFKKNIRTSNNPYIKEYAAQYVSAVQRIIKPDEPKPATAVESKAEEKPDVVETAPTKEEPLAPQHSTDEPVDPTPTKTLSIIQSLTPEELYKRVSDEDVTHALEKALKQELNWTDEELKQLSTESDPEKVKAMSESIISSIESLLDNNKIDTTLQMVMEPDDQNKVIASKLNISLEELEDMDYNKYHIIFEKLQKEGAFLVSYQNPAIYEKIREQITQFKAAMETLEKPKDNSEDVSPPEEPEVQGEPETHTAPLSLQTGTHDYIAAERPEILAEATAIKINPEAWTMTIAGQNPSSFFNDRSNYETAIMLQQAKLAEQQALALATQQDFTRSASAQTSRPTA